MNHVILSVIIVNYNGMSYLESCFQSLYTQLSNINYEIIVVDNLSTDNSCQYIKEFHPVVHLIESKENLGFGKGNNLGVDHSKGKYVLLFNNDTILNNPIDRCISILEHEKNIGVIGCKMLNGNGDYLPAAGFFPQIKNMFFFNKLYYKDRDFISGDFTKELYDVDWLAGSFLFLERATYLRVNGFDEDYFMYVEDVDFSKKIADLNLRRCFISSINYIHFVGFTTQKNHMLIKGYQIYTKKHFIGIKRYIVLTELMLKSFVKRFI